MASSNGSNKGTFIQKKKKIKNNSEYMKHCIYCLYIVQFRNYIRARVNALLIGHVTPPLWTQLCFECTEISSWLTFLLFRIVLNAKKVADEK